MKQTKAEYSYDSTTEIFICKQNIEARVVPIKQNTDPNFQFDVTMNESTFKAGDVMEIEINTSRFVGDNWFIFAPLAPVISVICALPGRAHKRIRTEETHQADPALGVKINLFMPFETVPSVVVKEELVPDKLNVTTPLRAVSIISKFRLVVSPQVPDCSPVAGFSIPVLVVYELAIYATSFQFAD